MNSDNIITNEEKHAKWSIEQLNTQRACHFQITYYKSTHARHKIQLQTMMEIYIYREKYRNCIGLKTIAVTISNGEMKRQIILLFQHTVMCSRPNRTPITSYFSKGSTMGTLDNFGLIGKRKF